MPVCLRLLLLGLWLACFAGVSVHAAPAVVIVSSERGGAYGEAAEALIGELERGGLARHEVLQLTALEFAGAGALTPKLFVTLGLQAAQQLASADLKAPVLCTLLPRSSFETVLRDSGRKLTPQFSALFLDQPLRRQLDLIVLAMPQVRRIGVLWGPQSQGQATALGALAKARGLELEQALVGGDNSLFSGLRQVLQETDLVLALPDAQVYNSASIQNILLTSFRARVPLMAFSPAYVRAGALLALYVSPAQLGLQAALIARGVLQGQALSSAPLYSQDFSVTVNEHVARSLDLSLEPQVLRARLRRLEGGP